VKVNEDMRGREQLSSGPLTLIPCGLSPLYLARGLLVIVLPRKNLATFEQGSGY
jgi:hypothetical protein